MPSRNIRVSLSAGSAARVMLVGLALGALAALVWAARNLVFAVFFGILVALFLSVLVAPLMARGLSRLLALVIVLAVLAVVLIGGTAALWPMITGQAAVLAGEIPEIVVRGAQWVRDQYASVLGQLPGDPEEMDQRVRERLTDGAGRVLGGAMPVLNSAVGAVTGAVVALATGVYVAANPGLYRRGVDHLVPPRHRSRVGSALDRTASSLRRWMVGTLINMVVVGTMTGVAMWLLGVPAAIALGAIAGVLEFVPVFGPVLASVPAIALGLTVSPATGLWVALVFIGVQQIESNVLTPLVMKGAARLPPALTLIFQVFMTVVFGFLGLFLAVPVLAAAMILIEDLYVRPLEARDDPSQQPLTPAITTDAAHRAE